MALSWATPTHAQEYGGCERLRMGQLLGHPSPRVLFLGERRGTRKDLSRARRIVRKLAASGPVTLALEVVDGQKQNVLDRLSEGKLTPEKLPEALGWEASVGFDYRWYERLLRLYAQDGVQVSAVGQPVQLRPDEQTLPLPPGYALVLADAMGEGPVPPELEERLVQTAAWRDHRVAQAALDSWSGEGWLVVVVDRAQLEGGLGVQWQARQLTDAPVDFALLADAGSRCYKGDRLLK